MPAQKARCTPVIVTLPAQIDLTTYAGAYEELYAAFDAGAAVVIADLTGTTFCDCASLRGLVAVQGWATARNVQLRLAIPPDSPVRRLARLMGLDHVRFYPSPREADKDIPSREREGPASVSRAWRRSRITRLRAAL